MNGLYLEYGQDLVLTPSGSLQMASGWDLTRQTFERALLTNPVSTTANGVPIPPDYIFEPTFGVGAGEFVGENLLSASVLNDFNQRMSQAAAITPNLDPAFPPQVQLQQPQPHEYVAVISLHLLNNQTGTIQLQV